MKRILIISHGMEIGGAERALLGMLDNIDYTKYIVDLFLLRHSGELLDYINRNVNLLPEVPRYACLAVPLINVLKKGHFLIGFGRLLGKFKAKWYVKKHGLPEDNGVAIEYSHKYTKAFMPKIQPNIKYDLVISFLTPHYFAAEKVMATKKIAWIHTDYSVVKLDTKSELKMWSKFDRIISISDKVSEAFVSVFPQLSEKLTIIENIQPENLIRQQADEFTVESEMSNRNIKLLSIGRFSNAKNFDNVPFICKKIVEFGLNVKWYLIGYGGDEQLIRDKIVEAGMQERVIILGKKKNPYPYIKTCDIYVQPSRYEGKCVTVKEAQMLGKPVVITKYATSASQFDNGMDGVIVPMDNEGCAAGIAAVLRDPTLMERLAANCRNRDYSNSSEVEKLYRLIEES